MKIPHLSQDQMIQKAVDIAVDIQDSAIIDSDGSHTWKGVIFDSEAEQFQYRTLGYNLYDGNCGIALFLAALTRITGHTQFWDTALNALSTEEVEDNGIGGCKGFGSIIYSLVSMSRILNLPELIDQARLAADLITDEDISVDRKLDIFGGAAGAVLGLLALYRVTEEPAILDKMIACGRHLLASRPDGKDHSIMTGFSHGAAGIAYSLLKLYEMTRDDVYLEAARSFLVYENTYFVPDAGNWREVTSQPTQKPVFWTTWCHGAPGIGLGRLGGLSIYRTEDVMADVDIALETTLKQELQDLDHPCCGNSGRWEVMLVAAEKLSNPKWNESARELAAKVVMRSDKESGYRLSGPSPDSVFTPSFFQGASGIGYQLLRLACPDVLPSVLLLE